MALELLTLLLVLLLGVLAPEMGRLRSHLWLREWAGWWAERGRDHRWWQSELGVLALLLPPLLAVGLINWVLSDVFYGLLGFAFGVAMLYFCWGPRDLDEDVAVAREAANASERLQALHRLSGDDRAVVARSGDLVEAVFAAALQRWFGVLFWFLVFGPVGALGFRMLQLLAQSRELRAQLPEGPLQLVGILHDALAWIPAQLMTLALALASDFDAVAKAWREHHEAHGQGLFHLDLGFLSATARACVETDDEAFVEADGQPVRDEAVEEARRLAWRLMVVWMAGLALIVLAGWSA